MRRTISVVALVIFLLAPIRLPAATPDDEADIRELLAEYVVGWRDADRGRLESVFALDGLVLWVNRGDVEALRTMTFREAVERRGADPDYGHEWSVERLDIVDGRVAVARLEIGDRQGGATDFMTLYKVGDRWQIVANAFVTWESAADSLPDGAPETTAAIERAVEGYVVGWRAADVRRLSTVFAADGVMLWVGSEPPVLQSRTFGEVLENRRPRPGYGEGWRIESLSVAGARVAVARVHIPVSDGRHYTDLLGLYRIGEEWRIVSKAFALQR